MALGVAMMRINLELYRRGMFKGFSSVFDMGAQDLLLTFDEFKRLMAAGGIAQYDDKAFLTLIESPDKRMGTESFYRLLGFTTYRCCDIGGGLHGLDDTSAYRQSGMRWNAIRHDLNVPITDEALLGQFDLVTDYGNNEHVFNVAEAYRSMHNLTRKNGIMLIHQQVYKGNGYYNFMPHFFEDMAAANKYEIIFGFYELRSHFIPVESDILDVVERTTPVNLVYAMRKTSDGSFKIPYQDDVSAMKKQYGAKGFAVQYLPDTGVRCYVPVISDDNLDRVTMRQAISMFTKRMKRKLYRLLVN